MAENDGILFPQVDADGNQKIVQEPLSGSEAYFYSPDVCQETSWYENSIVVTEQSLTDSSDHQTWNGPGGEIWIDLKHGKVMNEDVIVAATPTLALKVEVSTDGGTTWTPKTENTWGKEDGDYTADYANGTVTFNDALGATDQVRASYHKSCGAFQFTVAPAANKRLKLNYVEVQFTEDVAPTGAAMFQIWAYNPYDLPNKVMVAQRVYKAMFNYHTESTGPFSPIPVQGPRVVVEATGLTAIQEKVQQGFRVTGTRHNGTDWVALMVGVDPAYDRGLGHKVVTIPFNYLAYRDLRSSQGVEIRVVLENGAFAGSKATFTFYCLTEDE